MLFPVNWEGGFMKVKVLWMPCLSFSKAVLGGLGAAGLERYTLEFPVWLSGNKPD